MHLTLLFRVINDRIEMSHLKTSLAGPLLPNEDLAIAHLLAPCWYFLFGLCLRQSIRYVLQRQIDLQCILFLASLSPLLNWVRLPLRTSLVSVLQMREMTVLLLFGHPEYFLDGVEWHSPGTIRMTYFATLFSETRSHAVSYFSILNKNYLALIDR